MRIHAFIANLLCRVLGDLSLIGSNPSLLEIQRFQGSQHGSRQRQAPLKPFSALVFHVLQPGVHSLAEVISSSTVASVIPEFAHPRSTAIHARVQTDPSRHATERVSAKIATAFAGKPQTRGLRNGVQRRSKRSCVCS